MFFNKSPILKYFNLNIFKCNNGFPLLTYIFFKHNWISFGDNFSKYRVESAKVKEITCMIKMYWMILDGCES